MTREQLAMMIRNECDQKPSDWKDGETGWDDGADRIADKIVAKIEQIEKERFKYENALMLIGSGYGDAVGLANAALTKKRRITMELKPVKSSQIHAIGYDPAKQEMHIQFHARKGGEVSPGSIYAYEGITPEQHAALIGADSIGRHFGAHIKGNAGIKFRKLEAGKP